MPEPISPGASRDPRYFVGRASTTHQALRLLREGRELSLTDPRRLGKTYWLRALASKAPDLDVVLVDYEGVTSAEEFLIRTAEALRDFQGLAKGTRDRLSSIFRNVELGAGPITLSVAASSQSPYKLLADTIDAVESRAERVVVIAMDEVPIAIQSIVRHESSEAGGQVLSALRSLRQRTRRVRWIMAGSVGFHHVLRLAGVTEGALNDLEVVTLGPLATGEDRELAERLIAGISRVPDEPAIVAMIDYSSAIPFVMHRIANVLLAAGGSGPVGGDEVEAAFDAFVADRDGSKAVTHLVTRLDDFYLDTLALAHAVLDHLALATAPVPLSDFSALPACDGSDLRPVLDDLVDDHYLQRTGSGLSWRYDVLRRIWVQRRYLA